MSVIIIIIICFPQVRAFAPQSGKLLYTIHDAHPLGVTAIAGSGDCTRIVSGGKARGNISYSFFVLYVFVSSFYSSPAGGDHCSGNCTRIVSGGKARGIFFLFVCSFVCSLFYCTARGVRPRLNAFLFGACAASIAPIRCRAWRACGASQP